MPVVRGMPVPVMDVVHMIAVRHRHMPAVGAVLMIVVVVRDMPGRFAFVEMPVVGAVNVPVVHVVDVIVVRNGYMSATRTVSMVVTGMSSMLLSCHELPSREVRASSKHADISTCASVPVPPQCLA